MEEIDTRRLSELLFVLKSADVARFKLNGLEIDFNLQPDADEDAEPKIGGFSHPPVQVAEPPKAEDTGSYHKLFGGNFPRFKKPESENE